MEDARKLAAAGCDFFVLPDNTAHIAMESPGEPFPIPGLHIGEVVAEQAARDGRTKVGILGTNWTMTGPVYPGALGPAWDRLGDSGRGGSQACPRHHHGRTVPWHVHATTRATPMSGSSKAEGGWLRRGGAGLHGNPAADHAGCFAAADPRFRRGCWPRRRSRWRLGSGRCRNGAAGRSARQSVAFALTNVATPPIAGCGNSRHTQRHTTGERILLAIHLVAFAALSAPIRPAQSSTQEPRPK